MAPAADRSVAIEPGSQDLAADVSVVFAMELTAPGPCVVRDAVNRPDAGLRSGPWPTDRRPRRGARGSTPSSASSRRGSRGSCRASSSPSPSAWPPGCSGRCRTRRRARPAGCCTRLNLPAGTDVTPHPQRARAAQAPGARAVDAARRRPGRAGAAQRRRAAREAGAAQRRAARGVADWPPRSHPAIWSNGSGATPSATCCGSATASSTSPASAGPQLTQTPKETVWAAEKVELWRYPSDRRTHPHAAAVRPQPRVAQLRVRPRPRQQRRRDDARPRLRRLPRRLGRARRAGEPATRWRPTPTTTSRRIIAEVPRLSGSPDVNVFGYCFGGLLSLLSRRRQPRPPRAQPGRDGDAGRLRATWVR